MALNVGTATTQDQLIVYLHSYLLGIGALYEPRRFNRTLTSRTDDAAECHWNARPLLRSTTWRTNTTRQNQVGYATAFPAVVPYPFPRPLRYSPAITPIS